MYKRALIRSKYKALMPITRAVQEGQEVYYMTEGRYADTFKELDIEAAQVASNTYTTDNGITITTSGDDDEFNYTIATRRGLDNNFIVYQAHSENYPNEIHCEAKKDDRNAEWLCGTVLKGRLVEEQGSITPGYKTYILEGSGRGTHMKACEEDADTRQECSSGCGEMSRTATCNGETGEWEYGEYDASSCEAKPEESKSCSALNSFWTSGTATRVVSCNKDYWTSGEWDDSGCERSCEGVEQELSRACSECGVQIRTVSGCNTRTGQWEYNDDWTECPAKPSTEEVCEEGSELKKTREVTCVNNAWIASETWDTSNCKKECDPDAEPVASQTCDAYRSTSDQYCGTVTRTVTCNFTTGLWETSNVQENCNAKPSVTEACGSDYSNVAAVKTRTATCNNSTAIWTPTDWDVSKCGCTTSTKPDSTKSCQSISSSYVGGTATRTVWCEGTTWRNDNNWSTSGCYRCIPGQTKSGMGYCGCNWSNYGADAPYTQTCSSGGTWGSRVFDTSKCGTNPSPAKVACEKQPGHWWGETATVCWGSSCSGGGCECMSADDF